MEKYTTYLIATFSLLLLVFLANLNHVTGYVTHEAVLSGDEIKQPEDGCGTFADISGKIGIKTKRDMSFPLMVGCALLKDAQFACPIEVYYEKQLCCNDNDCAQGQVCGSGFYKGFCTDKCEAPQDLKITGSSETDFTISFSPSEGAMEYEIEWCPIGTEFGSFKCIMETRSGTVQSLKGLSSDKGHVFRVRVSKPDSSITSCSAPGLWSDVQISPNPNIKGEHLKIPDEATPLPTPEPVVGPPAGGPGAGTCSSGTGLCSPETLRPVWGDLAELASQVCNKESSGDSTALNDDCLNGITADYSVGLFQINMLDRCPKGIDRDGSQCWIVDQNELEKCMLFYGWVNPKTEEGDYNINIERAYEIWVDSANARNNQQLGWCPWGGARACGIVTNEQCKTGIV
jgi:hypothetical protein